VTVQHVSSVVILTEPSALTLY